MRVKGRSLETLLEVHPFFANLGAENRDLLAGCASNVKFDAGEQICREGMEADRFYLIRYGRVAVEVFAPGSGPITIQTLHEGDMLGWSWILEPYRWRHDARALDLTRALAFDAECIRAKSEEDPKLGYELMKRCAGLIVERLHGMQLQLLDVYGNAVHA